MIKLLDYRGHIRNWKELCSILKVDTFLSREEREINIILKAYNKWGKKVGEHLNGMFAFALYNSNDDSYFCIRDHFGTKPFYYYITDDKRLLCGTSINKIINQKGFKKEINKDILQIYLTLSYVGGNDTFFKGIKKLMPGQYLKYKNCNLYINHYWKPQFNIDNTKKLDYWANEIHNTLKIIMDEVKENNEVVETFLSGGVDSSYILAISDAKTSNSCGYSEELFDESNLAKKTADILKRKHNTYIVNAKDYFNIVPYVMYNMEQPLGDASAIAFAIGCKNVAKHTKICLSGEGADEFFGGYNIYNNSERYGDELKNFYVGNTNIMSEDEKKRLLKTYNEKIIPINLVSQIYKEYDNLDPLTTMCNIDIQLWLEGDIYLNVDRMSTAVGLEVRMPITDRRIFDIATKIPPKFKVNQNFNKLALRKAASKVLPDEISFRKKVGFSVPIRIWLADERYNDDVIKKLNSNYVEEFFNKNEIELIWHNFINGNSNNWRKIWTIYTFLVWYEEYFIKR